MKRSVLVFSFLLIALCSFGQSQHGLAHKAEQALLQGEAALKEQKYNLADYYADKALKYEKTSKRAAEIKIQCMNGLMKTKTDSTKFIIALLELHGKDKSNPVFMRLLMQYFSWPGREMEMRQFANDEIRADSTAVSAWLLRGETYMKEKKWARAIADYQQAVFLDSTLVEAYYNIGVCYTSCAVETKDSLEAAHTPLIEDEKTLVDELLRKSLPYFEKVMATDPDRNHIDWAKAVYYVFYALGDERAKDLKELIEQ